MLLCHIQNVFSSIGIHLGSALMDLVNVFNSIEDQHMNIVSETHRTYHSKPSLTKTCAFSVESFLRRLHFAFGK